MSMTSQSSISKVAAPCQVIESGGDEDPAGVAVVGENFNTVNNGKAIEEGYKSWKDQVKGLQDALALASVGSTDYGFMKNGVPYPLNSFVPGTQSSINKYSSNNKYSSDLTFDDDDDFDDYDDDEDYGWQYQLDAGESLQVQYDAGKNIQPQFEDVAIPWLQDPAGSQKKPAATSSSSVAPSLSIPSSVEEKDGDEVLKKFELFKVKQFDIVQDYSDHHYAQRSSSTNQPSKDWTKKIQEEWKILKESLPDMIFVRVYEARMDLLRAVIVGAAGTPYHDGLFFFDVFCPSDYPNVPPQVYYYSGGLRLNPNLYKSGLVCLSLLNTWSGDKEEEWIPGRSTLLQVLVSIQALVLNANPFFNEPGYEKLAGDTYGERQSQLYNERTFILSLKTMLYTLTRPPKHFEDFVAGHFCKQAHDILLACKAHMEGTQLGCPVEEQAQDANVGNKSCLKRFKTHVADMVKLLVPAFTRNGAKNCEQFLPPAESATDTIPEDVRSEIDESGEAKVETTSGQFASKQ